MAGISYSHLAVLLSLRLLEGKSKSVLISIFVLVVKSYIVLYPKQQQRLLPVWDNTQR